MPTLSTKPGPWWVPGFCLVVVSCCGAFPVLFKQSLLVSAGLRQSSVRSPLAARQCPVRVVEDNTKRPPLQYGEAGVMASRKAWALPHALCLIQNAPNHIFRSLPPPSCFLSATLSSLLQILKSPNGVYIHGHACGFLNLIRLRLPSKVPELSI